jgi:hypothetical protein
MGSMTDDDGLGEGTSVQLLDVPVNVNDGEWMKAAVEAFYRPRDPEFDFRIWVLDLALRNQLDGPLKLRRRSNKKEKAISSFFGHDPAPASVSRDGSDSYSVRAPVVQQRRRLASIRLPAFSPDPNQTYLNVHC